MFWPCICRLSEAIVLAQIVKNGLDGNEFVGTPLVDMYVKCRFLEDEETIFNSLIKRDLVAWTGIIAGYTQDGQGEKAMKSEVVNSNATRMCEA